MAPCPVACKAPWAEQCSGQCMHPALPCCMHAAAPCDPLSLSPSRPLSVLCNLLLCNLLLCTLLLCNLLLLCSREFRLVFVSSVAARSGYTLQLHYLCFFSPVAATPLPNGVPAKHHMTLPACNSTCTCHTSSFLPVSVVTCSATASCPCNTSSFLARPTGEL